GCDVWSAHSRHTLGSFGTGPLGGILMRWLRVLLSSVFLLSSFLVVRRFVASGGALHDAGNVVFEHPDSGDDSGPSARAADGDVHHDVHGDGPVRLSLRGSLGGTPGSHLHSIGRRGCVHGRSVLVLFP